MKNPFLAVIHFFGHKADYSETDLFLFPQLGVSTVCKILCEAVFIYVAKGVCMCGLHTHSDACMGTATRSAHALLREQMRE